MTSSTKPEVRNLLQRSQERIKPELQATCTGNLVKFSRVIFELCERTDRQERPTDILVAILCAKGRSNYRALTRGRTDP